MELLGQGAKYPSGPARELYFHERTQEEKIAKMADAIQYLVSKMKDMGDKMDKLQDHSHSDGHVTIPFIQSDRVRFSESYFFTNPLGVEKP